MNNENPYSTPGSDTRSAPDAGEKVQKMIGGQKLLLYAMLVFIGANILSSRVPILGLAMFLAAAVMAVFGLAKVCSALGYHVVSTVLLCVTMIIPLLNLIILFVVNRQATARIREAGFEVGLMGAKA